MMLPRSRREAGLVLTVLLVFLLAACSHAVAGPGESQAAAGEPPPPPAGVATGEPGATAPEASEGPAADAAVPGSRTDTEEGILMGDDRPARLKRVTDSWGTNWDKRTIEYDELLSGGPPRDGIPSIDEPRFVLVDEAAGWLADNEPVIALEIEGDARAYPLQILTWHEIVNDVVGQVPVLVTFCPLCNSALTFDRRIDGQVFEFGTSGLLRNSDLVMYDRTTESLWQQLTGESIVGDLAGRQLTFVPSSIVSLADFRQAYPLGVVLSRDTGYVRDYGRNPYAGYDTIGQSPFLFTGELDGRLPAMARVVAVAIGEVDIAYPLAVLAQVHVINDALGGTDLVVFHAPGASSALGDSTIADAADVGATGVFDPNLDGRKLTFAHVEGRIVDEQTGSIWNVLGQAIDGPLAGERLTPLVHGDYFWFAWAAFKPETIIYQAQP